jgi:short-subunit dehydrogenase
MHTYNLLESFLFPPTSFNEGKIQKTLQGKSILITGASSGIGEHLAIFLSKLNIDLQLILVARREEKLEALKQSLQSKTITIHIIRADLRVQEDMNHLLEYLHQLPGGLDIVVSNAGLSINRPILQSLDRFHDFTRTMAINYFAPVELILSVIPLLQQKQGQIINISTINALIAPFPNWAAYQASKTAFDVWLQSTAPEFNKIGITTTSIYLPLVKTPMILPTKGYKNMPAMTPEHVAKIICRSMYTKQRRFKPWWLIFGELSSILFKKIIDYFFYKNSLRGSK